VFPRAKIKSRDIKKIPRTLAISALVRAFSAPRWRLPPKKRDVIRQLRLANQMSASNVFRTPGAPVDGTFAIASPAQPTTTFTRRRGSRTRFTPPSDSHAESRIGAHLVRGETPPTYGRTPVSRARETSGEPGHSNSTPPLLMRPARMPGDVDRRRWTCVCSRPGFASASIQLCVRVVVDPANCTTQGQTLLLYARAVRLEATPVHTS